MIHAKVFKKGRQLVLVVSAREFACGDRDILSFKHLELVGEFEADSSCDFVMNILRIRERLDILTEEDKKILKDGI